MPRNSPTAAPTPRSILLIRPSALGDVCRTVPVLASLRRAYPGAAIDWLVQDSYVDAVSAHPALSWVVQFPRRQFGKIREAGKLAGWVRSLGRAGYDVVLDCQGLARSGFFAWATRSKRRIGYADAAELGWLGLNERVRAPKAELHTVDRMLRLVEHLGAPVERDMRLYVPPGATESALADPLLKGKRYAVLAPTSRWVGKRWPADRFARVAAWLVEKGGVEGVVLVGGKDERAQCGPLLGLAASDDRVLDRVGTTGVGELMALIAGSALVIANDSAALHMAVGLDRPLIGLYGPTNVALVGPYRREADVAQVVRPGDRPDHKDDAAGRAMMERIAVDDVIHMAEARLGAGSGNPAGYSSSPAGTS